MMRKEDVPMERERNFWVVGGDLRQVKLVEMLENDGHTVHTAALEKGLSKMTRKSPPMDAARAHCVIMPLPILNQEGLLNAPLGERTYTLNEILDLLHPGQIVCGGLLSEDVIRQAEERGLRLFDYYEREECKIANAVPTAEGAIQVAMENMPATLHGSRVLVIGFGRVGKLTAHRLQSLGARVTVAARKCQDWAWAQAYGYGTEDTGRLAYWLGGYDLIINTVPAMILDRNHLERVQPGVFIIDLASLPGGIDFDAASDLGISAVSLPGIPGKTAPVTAAKAIRDSIYNILHELGV
jgi:dipicolinate synthase subunit A